ncbi:MAG: hypothetical protein QOI41_6787, partial [Myxococcales bacterium]|nr:hypothetical protein [Myxococcales bacterium]
MRASLGPPSLRFPLVVLLALCAASTSAPASADPAKPARPAGTTPAKRTQAVPASRSWHSATPGKTAPVDEHGRALLVLQGLNIPDRVELTPRSDRGGFSAEDLDRAAHVMRDHSGNEHPVDPRLLDLVYRIQAHFHAHEIRIISGYRAPLGASHATSNHGKGRAMDLVVPGASDEEVAKLAREEGFAGVGIYPVSGFVHVDVRERSYFWVDTSGPGKRSRIRGILGDVAAKSDAQAIARGERSVGPFHIGTDVDTAIASTAVASHAPPP